MGFVKLLGSVGQFFWSNLERFQGCFFFFFSCFLSPYLTVLLTAEICLEDTLLWISYFGYFFVTFEFQNLSLVFLGNSIHFFANLFS